VNGRFLFLLLLLAGCGASTGTGALTTIASGPTTTTVDTGRGSYSLVSVGETRVLRSVVHAPLAEVWSALPLLFEELQIPAGVVHDGTHVYGNPGLRVNGRIAGERPSRYLECGLTPIGASAADTYTLEVQLLANLQPSGAESTRLQLQLGATGTPRAGGSRSTCATTGALERRIAERLDELFR
jgi:hypothetical protein